MQPQALVVFMVREYKIVGTQDLAFLQFCMCFI